MPTVNGTPGNDLIDQRELGDLASQHIYVLAGSGDDIIIIATDGSVEGEAGSDTITSLVPGPSALYWGAPKGIVANLATGRVEDGYGTVDTLIGIRTIGGSPHNDHITGSADNDKFIGNGGSDTFAGNGGADRVVYFDANSSDALITYDATSDKFVIKKSFANGDKGTDTLHGIDTISFTGDGGEVTKYNFGSFPQSSVTKVTMSNSFVGEIRPGDFNGDGVGDILLVQQVGTGTAAAPMLIFVGDRKGLYAEASSQVFVDGIAMPSPGATTPLVGDFNNDGVTDIFNLGFGNDAPPFSGGTNSLFLSDTISRQLSDQSSSLSQVLDGNHGGSIGDVNGDGYLDVLVNGLADGNVLLINDTTGHFLSRPDYIPRPFMPGSTTQRQTSTWSGLIDVTGDGKVDVIIGKWAGTSSFLNSYVLVNDGSGNFGNAVPIALPSSAVQGETILDIQPIDLNGDNLTDLLVSLTSNDGKVSYSTPYIQVLLNLGGGQFRDETQARLPQATMSNTNNFGKLYPVDIDNDGFQDILVSGGGAVASFIFRNQGDGTFKEFWRSPIGALTVPGDINRDGMIDLLSYSGQGAAITSYINTLENGHIYKHFYGQNTLNGSAGNDTFVNLNSNSGLAYFNGGLGIDTAHFGAGLDNYKITREADNFVRVVGNGVEVILTSVERLQFSDVSLAFDLDGNAGAIAKLLGVVLGKDNWHNAEYVGIGLDLHDNSDISFEAFMELAFSAVIGSDPSNEDVVSLIYNNLVGQEPSQEELDMLVADLLDSGAYTQGSLGVLAADHDLNATNIDLVGLAQTGIEYILYG